MKHGQVNVRAVVASIAAATVVMVAMVVIAESYDAASPTVALLQQGAHNTGLEREIQLLRSQLNGKKAAPLTRQHAGKMQNLDAAEEATDDSADDEVPEIDITKPLLPETAHARAVGSWARQHTPEWSPDEQWQYDKAVSHAQIVEKGSKAVFQPLRLEKGYLHQAEDEENDFEEQIIGLAKMLEPAFLSEAVQWAQSGDTRETPVLEPFVQAIERPLVKDLELEARVRVTTAVDAIAAKEKLSLPEREQLRAHLMAPLMMRIRTRVHAHVEQYVTQMARELVLKAVNGSEPGPLENIMAARGQGGVGAGVPALTEADAKMVKALHDLEHIHKDGVIDDEDYQTQRAKLLSDWLKHSVNEAGGNANEVLRIVFGGEVKGVTTTGIKDESPIDVNKKLEMEKGLASMQEDRKTRMNKDLVAQLVKGKTQWGMVTDCEGKWEEPECKKKWKEIEDLVEAYAGHPGEEEEGPTLGEEVEARASKGTHRLFHHIGSKTDKVWHLAEGHAEKAHPGSLRAVPAAHKQRQLAKAVGAAKSQSQSQSSSKAAAGSKGCNLLDTSTWAACF
mmetsp:Transcript_3197/g.7574  ORF Transcript_3197/g.7574 Transcript_3197/m.7574 type:complete len:563 (+) Transcript_3197:111-1799(+)